MKKVNIRHLIVKRLLLAFVILFSFSTAFAQDASEGKNPEQEKKTEASKSDADDSAASSDMKGDPDLGKELFTTNCASCHKRYKKSIGPALHGITDKQEMKWIYDWIHNSTAMIEAGDEDAVAIYEEFNETAMTHFPQLSETDINNILAYVEQPKPEPKQAQAVAGTQDTGGASGGASNTVILVVLAVVLVLLVVILSLVNKTLNRFAKESGVEVPEKPYRKPIWKAFAENQFLVLVSSVILLLAGAYFIYGFLMQVGVDQGYQPIQPIHYSHRIHAGDNEIDCKYCHSSARVSKVSGIPSLNVCMNCHKSIGEVAPETATEDYSKEYYDGEIAKLYDAVGWDPNEQAYTGETKPVKWVRIHNLPDFAYFNHSQHVMVGGIACQKCHGPVQEYEVMKQYAPLTMGWCIDCHRETDVKMKGNKYYEKIHEELAKKYGVEKVTEAQMGGLECGRCHY